MPQLHQVQSAGEIDLIRDLLREYQHAIGVDLCFQGFDAELKNLPGSYAAPSGRLLLALHEGSPMGCIALQRIDTSRCEIKRLYVRPSARGLGIGRGLVATILREAKAIGYEEVLLDTLPTMTEAQRLYEQFGFHDVQPYRPNPITGTRYLAKKL